jgi:hypothetical protein
MLLLSVENAAAFIADPAVKTGVTNAIAEMANVNASFVNVTLSLTSRRLRGQDARRLAAASVTADYTILAKNATSANTLKSTLTAVSTSAIASSVATQLEAAGVNTTESYGGNPTVPQAMTATVQITYPPTDSPTVSPTAAPTAAPVPPPAGNSTGTTKTPASPGDSPSGATRAAQLLTPLLFVAVAAFSAMVGAVA